MAEMFKSGDKAIRVTNPSWGGARGFVKVEIGKVHKSGRLTLINSRDQWRHTRGFNGADDYFSPCGRGHDQLYPWSDDLVSEIRAEREAFKNRLSLNKVGEALSRIRSDEDAAELWAALPEQFKSLIE